MTDFNPLIRRTMSPNGIVTLSEYHYNEKLDAYIRKDDEILTNMAKVLEEKDKKIESDNLRINDLYDKIEKLTNIIHENNGDEEEYNICKKHKCNSCGNETMCYYHPQEWCEGWYCEDCKFDVTHCHNCESSLMYDQNDYAGLCKQCSKNN